MKLREILIFETDDQLRPDAPQEPDRPSSVRDPFDGVSKTTPSSEPLAAKPDNIKPLNPAKERLRRTILNIVAKYNQHAYTYTVALHELNAQGVEAYVAQKILKYGAAFVQKLFKR